VLQNGLPAAAANALAAGDVVAFLPRPADRQPAAVAILHDDPDFLVVDKPPHLVVHRHSAFPANAFLPELERRTGGPLEPVHRLDRQTSGVLLLARNGAAAARLQQQFAAGAVEKVYLAVARGVIAAAELTIDARIGRAWSSTVRDRRATVPAGTPGAKTALTHVRVLRRGTDRTLLEVRPATGRTHQIRVHLAHAGHPLLGDRLYGQDDAAYLAWVAYLRGGGDPRRHPRLLLHACELGFAHPRGGQPVRVVAAPPPDWPPEWAPVRR